MLRRCTLVIVLAIAALVGLAAPAGAHVELEPGEAVAGSTETLTFSFHHGLDGSATTALEVQMPEGAEVMEIGEVEGFTASEDPATRTVRWEGGSVPDGVEAEFPVTVTLPTDPGVVLFPTIQETVAGDLDWIGEEEDESEGSNSAPRLTLVADPNATTTTTAAVTTTDEVTSTTADLPGTTLEAANEGDGDAAAPWLIGAGIAALLAIVIGGLLLKRRADADRASDGEAAAPTGGDAPDGPGPDPS